MFNVGGGELLVIMLIALIVLGPDRLPGFARKAGKVMGDVRRISQGFQSELRQAMDLDGESTRPTTAPPSAPRLVEPPTPPAVTPPDGVGTSPGNDALPPSAAARRSDDDESTSGSSAA